jgi:hypothetical protein
MVVPIPFSIETTAFSIGILTANATARETIIKERNELNFNTMIRKRRRPIPRMTMSSGIYYFLLFSKLIEIIRRLVCRLRAQGPGLRAQGSGLRAQGLGLRAQSS